MPIGSRTVDAVGTSMEHEITLDAGPVRLVPLTPEHAPGLLPLIDDGVWAGMASPTPHTVEQLVAVMEGHLLAPDRYPFAVLDAETGEVRGSTAFYDVNLGQQRAEIGHTYYGRQWWGGVTNPACKLALFTLGFEEWRLHR